MLHHGVFCGIEQLFHWVVASMSRCNQNPKPLHSGLFHVDVFLQPTSHVGQWTNMRPMMWILALAGHVHVQQWLLILLLSKWTSVDIILGSSVKNSPCGFCDGGHTIVGSNLCYITGRGNGFCTGVYVCSGERCGGASASVNALCVCMWMHLSYAKDKQSCAVAWQCAGKWGQLSANSRWLSERKEGR